jgi:hypothetical protein
VVQFESLNFSFHLRPAWVSAMLRRAYCMPLHYVRIIEEGHLSTQRLFDLGLSFGICKRKRHWPRLETMNSFLKKGIEEGKLGTTIEWQSCPLPPVNSAETAVRVQIVKDAKQIKG